MSDNLDLAKTEPLDLSMEQRFDALRMRYEDHVELLRMLTLLDLRLFSGVLVVQLALGSWLATGPVADWWPLIGILVLDGSIAAIGGLLLWNNALRRIEAVATLKNVMATLGFYKPGFYVEGLTINAPGRFRLWAPWYALGIAIAYAGLVLVTVAAKPG